MPTPAPSRRSFLQRAAGLAALGLTLTRLAAAADAPLMAYVATYSSPPLAAPPGKVDLPPGNGRGIHLFRVDRTTGALTPAGIFPQGTSPSCLVINADGTRMYSTNATDKIPGSSSGTVSAFAIDRADGQLTLLNTVPSGGAGPTYVSIHPSGKFALVANYTGGTVSVFPILADGRLGPASDTKQSTGTVGPKRAHNAPPGSFAISGHDFPHAHMITTDRSGRHVLAADLGLDKLLVWTIDERTGKLSPNDPPDFSFPPGDGPRHFAFHPNARWLYSLQEEGSNLAVFDYDGETGRLTHRQMLSTLPPGFAGTNFTSGIQISPDGRFVYVSNRLHDSIAWFAIGETGLLTRIDEEWSRGDYPRTINLDPTGRFLYSCNQRSDSLATFRIDQASGRLTFTGEYTPVGNPSMMVFLDLAKGK